MTISFNVDSVKPSAPRLDGTSKGGRSYQDPRRLTKDQFEAQLSKVGLTTVESSATNATEVEYQRPDANSFLEIWRRSYDEHVPLIMGPDEVWVALTQAVATHVRAEPENTRRAMGVTFEGKTDLVVNLPGFIKGAKDNPWNQAFAGFSDALAQNVGKKVDLFNPTFSTTGAIEKATIQVQMMDAFASYFEYYGRTMCGVPSIHLLGTQEDWKAISTRVQAFGEIVPSWIHEPLLLVATEFEKASSGKPNLSFWQNFLKVSGGSGGPYITGFINAFFPYIGQKNYKNTFLNPAKNTKLGFKNFEERVYSRGMGMEGPNPDDLHSSICSVPMTWLYYSETIKMRFAAGIVGITADNSVEGGGYRCALGWTVGEASQP